MRDAGTGEALARDPRGTMRMATPGDHEARADGDWHNLLEPPSLIEHFLRHPPEGFRAVEIGGTTPAFVADFDLTTTVDAQSRRGPLAALLWRIAGRLLTLRTCFVGTTVSEYVLLPRHQPAAAIVDEIARYAADCSLAIIKDIPSQPVLVNEASLQFSDALIEACRQRDFFMVEGQALAYVPVDFASIEAYLARMSRMRRKEIRRKLRSAAQLEVQTIPTGAQWLDNESVLSELYALYRNVYEQSTLHFDRLSIDFFRAVLQDGSSGGVIFTYRAAGQLIGFNLCFVRGDMLLDKYVGFVYPQARDFNLYFVSWFQNLEFALQRGLKCYVAGWTDPEIKRRLGACFTLTRHAVYVRNRWLRRLLAHFRHHFEADAKWQQTAR